LPYYGSAIKKEAGYGKKRFHAHRVVGGDAIIAILAAILFPVFARAREKARMASCQSNVKQQALGVMMYAQDYDEMTFGAYGNSGQSDGHTIPPGPVTGRGGAGSWWLYPDFLDPYTKNAQIFRCPSNPSTWGYNANQWSFNGSHTACGRPMSYFNRPAERIGIFDSPGLRSCGLPHGYRVDADGPWAYCYGTPAVDETKFLVGAYSADRSRHNDGCNYSFMDGHVKWMSNSTTYYTGTAGPPYTTLWACN